MFRRIPPCLLCAALALADSSDTRTNDQKLGGFDVARIGTLNHNTDDDKDRIADLLVPDQNAMAFLFYALPPKTVSGAFKDFLKTIEAARVDQQLGANPSVGAASSTVAKAGVTSLVAFALESGAITQSIDQNVATLHANGDGLFRFLSNQEVIPSCISGECQASWARNLDLSASFNVNGSTTKTLTGQTAGTNMPVDVSALFDQHQFSSATVQYALQNQRDLRSKAYRDSFAKWFKQNKAQLHDAGRVLIRAVGDLLGPIEAPDNAPGAPLSSPYSRWRVKMRDTVAAAAASDPAKLADTIAAQLDDLIARMRQKDPLFDSKLQAAFQAYVSYFSTRDQLGRNMITTPQYMVQATYSEPRNQPKLFNAKFSYSRSPGSKDPSECGNGPSSTGAVKPAAAADAQSCGNPGTFTVNFGIDLYQKEQPTGVATNTSRFRDAQFALQFDRPLGPGTSPAQLSLGFYYQYQRNPGIFVIPTGATAIPGSGIPLTAAGTTVLTDTKGSLYVGQAVVTVQIPAAGLKIPIGISYSNHTDLLPGNEVRGHIGFTFNSEGPLLSLK